MFLDCKAYIILFSDNNQELPVVHKRRLRSKRFDQAYDYSTGISTVEIESDIEVKSHPEHVRFNMKKWPKLGFEECHVWSSSKTIEKMHKELDELHNKVRTFVVKLPDDYKPKICPSKQPRKHTPKPENESSNLHDKAQ